MKFKLSLLLLILCVGYDALADNNYVRRPLPKSVTSIVSTTAYQNDVAAADYDLVMNELLSKIEKSPENYSLYISVIDLALRAKKYDVSITYLNKLKDIKDENELSPYILNQIANLKEKTIALNKYTRVKSPVYMNLALMSLLLEENSAAEKYVKLAVSNCVDTDMLRETIQTVFWTTGNYENAVAVCNFYLSLYRNDIEMRKVKINYLAEMNNYLAILNEFNSMPKEEVDDDIIYKVYMSLIQTKASEREILRTLFDSDAAVNRKYACYYSLFKLADDREDYETAQKYAEKLKKDYPETIEAAFAEVSGLIHAGKDQEAMDLLESSRDKIIEDYDIQEYDRLMMAITAEPMNELISLYQQGHVKKVLDIIESGTIPETPGLNFVKARCLIDLGQLDKAYGTINELNDSFPTKNFVLALYYFATENYDFARKYLEKQLIEFPDQTPIKAKELLNEINQKEAEQYVNQILNSFDAQNYPETMRLINKALSIDPNSSELYFYKGLTLIAQNNYAASTAALYKSIELDNNNAFAYYYLAIAFDNLSEKSNALSYYKKFLNSVSNEDYNENDKIEYANMRIQKIQSGK